MPLLNHFHPPLKTERHWEGFHSFWASAITQQLNKSILPEGYVAEPQIKMGSQVEIDIATLEQENGINRLSDAENGGVATALYAPPHPPLVFPVDFTDLDVFEIQVLKEEGGLRLVGAIELISPANKDRPSHRQAFGMKCASYLQQGIAVILVDIVTERSGNLHAELLKLLEPSLEIEMDDPDLLYATAYRTLSSQGKIRVEAWLESLNIGKPLPTLPLWLSSELVVPVNLEQSYLTTCESLRIRVK